MAADSAPDWLGACRRSADAIRAMLADRPTLDGIELDCSLGERRTEDGKLEVLGVESADPRWVVQSADALAETAHRLRAIGAIAVSLCQVAAARFDAMATLKRTRAVDAAAAQLIVREAGGRAGFDATLPAGGGGRGPAGGGGGGGGGRVVLRAGGLLGGGGGAPPGSWG